MSDERIAITNKTVLNTIRSLTLEIDDADYTIQDSDYYKYYVFKNLTADRTLTFPSLTDNPGKEFNVINASGSYDVNCSPEGSDYLNDWQQDFPITEKGGEIKFLATAAKWAGTPLNDACIYEVSSETADTGLALDGTWDDVSGMTLLNGIYGKGLIDGSVSQNIIDTSDPQYLRIYWGIGKTSGNNAPDIFGGNENIFETYLAAANTNYRLTAQQSIFNFPYVSDGSIIYMKLRAVSSESPATSHTAKGDTDRPMFIKFIRTY